MSAADGLALVVLVGLTAYAVLGGADFGAGVWDLLAAGPRRQAQRELLARAMGPVWEANHVWLIFVVITLFSGFPAAFAALSTVLLGPLSLALLGIVLRGAAFVFRQYGAPHGGPPVRGTVAWGRVFAASSTITPFAFGAAAGALSTGAGTGKLPAAGAALADPTGDGAAAGAGLADPTGDGAAAGAGLADPTGDGAAGGAVPVDPSSGAVPAGADGGAAGGVADVAAGGGPAGAGGGGVWEPFLAPLPLVAGGLAVACCAYLAAVYLARDAERVGDAALVADFRRRAIAAGVVAGALALGALPLLPPQLSDRLSTVGAPAVALSLAAGVTALVLLWRRRHSTARLAAAGAVASLLWGWAAAGVPGMSLQSAAAPPAIAGAVLGVLLAGLAIVLPCYLLLVRTLRVR